MIRLNSTQFCFDKAGKSYVFGSVHRDISGPEYRWALKMGQRPISHSFTYKNQDFDGPFCILMGLLEKNDGPKNPY